MRNKRRKNGILLGSLLAVVLVMGIGYATFSTKLNINGTGSISSKFNVEITNIETKNIVGGASNKTSPTYTSNSANFSTLFKAPGDSISYDITITNGGTIDAIIDSIKVNAKEQGTFEFLITNISSKEELLSGKSKTFTLTVKFSDNITSMPSDLSSTFTLNLEYLQKGKSTNFSNASDSSLSSGFGITSVVTSVGETSITTTISASNAVKYYYSLDNDKWYESDKNSYTINNLKPYTNYTVYVKAQNSNGEVVTDRNITMTEDNTKPKINLSLGENVKGNNNWYKGATINIDVTDNDSVKSSLYCITTEDSCTPTKEVTGSVQLSSNALAQKLCVKAVDRKGNTSTECTGKYNVDSVEPVISNMTLTTDDDTMTIVLNASDSHSGVYKYYFSKDSGKTYIESNNPNYTFASLDEGDYLVTAYVVDKAGIKSEISTKSTTIKHAAFCKHNGIDNFGDCIIASEKGTTDIAAAKQTIQDKGTPTFTKTSPEINYSEKHATTTSTFSRNYYHNIGTSYTFNQATGYYTLKNYSYKDPSTVDYSTGDYYTCDSTNVSCTTLYKITKVTSSKDATTNAPTYTLTYYPYTASVASYDNSEAGMYALADDSGTSYYYRGAVSGNYVKFGGFYWRIIRVNGDGSVRMIYDGTSAHDNGETSSNRQIGTQAFNSWWSDNAYVGYMYGDTSNNQVTEANYSFTYTGLSSSAKYYFGTSYTFDKSTNTFKVGGTISQLTLAEYNASHNTDYLYSCFSTSSTNGCYRLNHIQKYASPTSMIVKLVEYSSTSYGLAHTNTKNSTIKTYLDNWYSKNLSSVDSKISKDAVFCNNRQISTIKNSTYTNEGYGSHPTFYGYTRFYGNTTGPTLNCPQANDKFSVSSKNGNSKLTYPAGLITADEINMAGGRTNSQNPLYYLYTGTYYWSMSPSRFSDWGDAFELYVSSVGSLDGSYVAVSGYGVRPVVNLTSENLTFTGSGTKLDPYVVS